ncbi:integrin beta-1-like [Synchiropus picturatus]
MMVTWLSISLLLTLLSPSWAGEKPCPTSAADCNQCIQSNPACAWCSAPGDWQRCNTVRRHHRAGCTDLYHPQGELYIHRNQPRRARMRYETEEILLAPQEIALSLRPGVTQSFNLDITADQPVPDMDTSGAPEGLNITFSKQSEGARVNVRVEVAHCRDQNQTGPWSIQITPRGISQSLKLTVEVACECECMKKREENSPACSGRGTLQCSVCHCKQPYHGKHCQVDPESTTDDAACRPRPGSPVCSGNGKCVDGFCECRVREIPTERYSGRFCECDNFSCPYHQRRMCGGRGRCECGECICDEGWAGEYCGCLMDATPCMAQNQQICNGKGTCECGQCKCSPPYQGPTCEDCPSCTSTCAENAACVECRAFHTGAKKSTCDEDCAGLILRTVDSRDDIPQGGTAKLCRRRSRDDSCIFHYSIEQTPAGPLATVWRQKQCPPSL